MEKSLPQASSPPQIAGAAARTTTLTSTAGTWTNSPSTIAYQWQRCDADGTNCQPISGQTDSKYTLVLADENHMVTVKVTSSNTSGTGTASARPTATIAGAPPALVHAPTLTGTAQQDESLSLVKNATSDVFSDTPDTTYATTWKRCDADGKNCLTVTGQTRTDYPLTSADVGHTLIVAVTATNPDGSATGTSQPSSLVVPAAPRWRKPLIATDPGHVGNVLSITAGAWSRPKVDEDHVQMMYCTNQCSPVGTDGADSYTIATGDLGAILRVREYALNAGGTTVIWSARYVGPVSNAAVGSGVVADGASAQLRNSTGMPLASATLLTGLQPNAARLALASAPASAAAHAHAASARPRTLLLRRGRHVTGTLKAWACSVSNQPSGAPGKCTRIVRMGARTTLTVPANVPGRLRVIVRRSR